MQAHLNLESRLNVHVFHMMYIKNCKNLSYEMNVSPVH